MQFSVHAFSIVPCRHGFSARSRGLQTRLRARARRLCRRRLAEGVGAEHPAAPRAAPAQPAREQWLFGTSCQEGAW